jgi:hypothetical protein
MSDMQINSNSSESPSLDDIARVIGDLALGLHVSDSSELNGKLPSAPTGFSGKTETPDYKIEDDVVLFPTIEARNRIVAAHVFKERKALPSAEQAWLETAYDLWRHEIQNSDTATGRLLAHVHETSDIFVMAAEAIKSGAIQVFHARLTVECAFPYIQTLPAEGIWQLCNAQHELTKNDMAVGVFFGKLGNALTAQPEVCRALHERLTLEATESTANLYPTAIMALARSLSVEAVRLTLEDTNSANAILKSVALWTAGQLIIESFVDDQLMPEVTAVLMTNMSSSVSNVRRTALRAAAIASRVTDSFVDVLTRLGELEDEDGLGAIAETLWRNRQEIQSKPCFHDWVRLLSKTPASSKGILDQFDHILSQMLADESEHTFVLSCVKEWVRRNGTDGPRNESFSKLFNLFTSELAQRPYLLSQLITDWLLSDGNHLPAAAGGLLSYLGLHGLKNPTLDPARLDELEEMDLIFLARRLVGFILSEAHSLSLAMSLFKTRDAPTRAFPILRSLLADELGYDYPHSTIEALEAANSATSDAEWNAFYSKTIETIRDRIKVLNELPRLTELETPPELRRQLMKARAKQMNKAMEGARQESVIRRIVYEVPIKGGIGYFSFRDGAYTEPGYLKSLSHSISLPRRVVLDTVGYELSLFMLRNAKRGES